MWNTEQTSSQQSSSLANTSEHKNKSLLYRNLLD